MSKPEARIAASYFIGNKVITRILAPDQLAELRDDVDNGRTNVVIRTENGTETYQLNDILVTIVPIRNDEANS